MKYSNTILILILTFFGISVILSQDCTDYYKKDDCKRLMKKDFYLMSHSRSTVFEINTESQIIAALSGGYDYIVSCCTFSGYYPIHMQIVSQDGSHVFFDNMYDDYVNSIGFTLDNTQILTIKVKLLAKGIDPEDFEDNRACLGLTIQYRKTPNLGF